MIDLSAYDLRPLSERLRRIRSAKDFRERQALLQAADFAGLPDRARPTARRASQSARAFGSGLPYTGPGAPSPGADEDKEDEWAMRRPGAGGGGGAVGRVARGLPAGSIGSSGAGASASRAAGVSPSLTAKAGLARGAQAAVVKLASYGSGSARAASLLNYQSDKGELALEREDGTLVAGKAAVADLAAHWSDDDAREPSNDILRIALTLEGGLALEQARAGLAIALNGHRYAWRIEERPDATNIHLVAVAAGALRDDSGKKQRIYANAKSLDRLQAKFSGAFGRDVELSAPIWAHGVEGATTALAALTRGGEVNVETDAGVSLEEAADRQFTRRPSNANRERPKNFNPALEIAKSWRPAMRSSGPRDFAHVILSAKPGTDEEAFMDAARATLAREFDGHEYVFVMHTNRQHIHVHAAVRLSSPTGQKLHPGIEDFNRWRQTLAEQARERHIAMEAVRRFDQAHAPAYKLKDAKMVERGVAPETVRRRIERAKNEEVHRPTREEGRRRAIDVAGEWKSLASQEAVLPPLAAGALRLYRVEPANDRSHHAPLFFLDRELAQSHAPKGDALRLVYLDVPAERICELRPSREQPTKVFVAPPELSGLRKPLLMIEEATVSPFQRRAEAALTQSPERPNNLRENPVMRTAQTMEAARREMADAMSRIGDYLPEGAVKDDLMRRARDILARAEAATKEQARLERNPGQIEGDRFIEPEAKNLGALFTHEKKGSEIHYRRHDRASGAFQTLAFIDKGKQLDVRDWSNRESVNAALKLAAQKWETLSVSGSAEYKETVALLAAENGYEITNPELQGRIRQLRAEIEARRAAATQPNERPAPHDLKAPAGAAPPQAAARDRAPADQPSPNATSAERAIELNGIRERVDSEAKRETRQAAHAAGPEKTLDHTPSQARAARQAARAVDDSPTREIPADPAQSEAIEALGFEQRRVLDQAKRDEQRRIDLENAERFRKEERRESRDEAEGESM